ncbi:MATE family efflux transporter [uncultured Clostridium sp.]|uniref:MATE family efflux transporter n=1 Tax=uncultured Clostridium sp. TaxID=59620 RepID=UPI00261EF57A|nr:MATE family efflux transporter [uncultured Clostridium sp.]
MIKEFLKYSLPSSFGMLIVGIYIVITGIFVSKGIGAFGLAAIVIATPLTMIVNSFSTIFSMGGATVVSVNLGKKNIPNAINVFRQTIFFSIIISLIFGIISIFFLNSIVTLLGANSPLKVDVYTYLFYYLIFIIPIVLQGILNTFLRNDNAPAFAMYIMIFSAIITLILEYVFIFNLHMGLKGVAISAGIGQTLATIIELIYFFRKKGTLTLGFTKLRFNTLTRILKIGFPTFFVAISYSAIIFFTNYFIIRTFGEDGMTSYGIINYILSISYYAITGVCNGIQPLISFHFGANNYYAVEKTYDYSIIMNVLISIIFFIICLIFGKDFIKVFTDSQSIVSLTYIALNAANLAYIFLSINFIDITFFQSIEKPILSNIICLERGFIYSLLSLFILTYFFKYGVWYAMLLSESLATLTTFIFFRLVKNHYKLSQFGLNVQAV